MRALGSLPKPAAFLAFVTPVICGTHYACHTSKRQWAGQYQQADRKWNQRKCEFEGNAKNLLTRSNLF